MSNVKRKYSERSEHLVSKVANVIETRTIDELLGRAIFNLGAAKVENWSCHDLLNYSYDQFYEELFGMTDEEFYRHAEEAYNLELITDKDFLNDK